MDLPILQGHDIRKCIGEITQDGNKVTLEFFKNAKVTPAMLLNVVDEFRTISQYYDPTVHQSFILKAEIKVEK